MVIQLTILGAPTLNPDIEIITGKYDFNQLIRIQKPQTGFKIRKK